MDTMREVILASIEDDSYLLIKFIGDIVNDDIDSLKLSVDKLKDLFVKLSKLKGNKVLVLIDITNFGGDYVSETLDLILGLGQENNMTIKKVAGFGGTEKVRLIVETVGAMIGSNIRLFENKVEAKNWLKEI